MHEDSNDEKPAGENASAAETTPTPLSESEREFRENLNHKLRTPLNAIIGYAELLALQPGSKRDNSDVQQILKSAREMLVTIEEELLERGASEASHARTKKDSCDLLYVEDDMVNFTLVERILEYRPQIKLLHAARGQLGIEMAERYRPRMVLLDLNLPDMDGSEVLKALQNNSTTAEIPVVILSANATPSYIERLLTAGAKNYLTKPFDIDPFLAVIDEFTVAA